MIYRAPFTAITKSLNTVLKNNSAIGLEWFDSAVPINEIDDYFRTQAQFAYGVYGESDADCKPNKTAVVWDGGLQLEIYSNYKGRKIVAQKLEALLNYLSSDTGFAALSTALGAEGYVLVALTVGPMRVNLPMYSEKGVWQSGGTSIRFQLHQVN
jgi:hypothetical protein